MKATYYICLVIFSGLLAQSTIAKEALFLRHESSSAISFSAQARVRKELTPYADWKAKASPLFSHVEQLLSLFENAENSFINAPADQAIQKYLKVLDLSLTDHWNPEHRKILFTSALRAAHLSLNSDKITLFINRAIYFYDQQDLDPNKFPPPVIQLFNKSLQKTHFQKILANDDVLKFDKLKVQGKLIDIQNIDSLQLPPGQFLVTLYSSTYKTQSIITNAQNFSQWKPEIIKLVDGSCKKPILSEEVSPHKGYVFFSKSCIPSFGKLQPLELGLGLKKSSHSPSKINPLLHVNQTTTKVQPRPWWQKKWIWYTLAGASAAYLIYENNREKDSSRPNPSEKTSEGPTTVFE